MITLVLVVHMLLALALIIVVLLQRSEGGALGIGGSNAFMSVRGASNLLTRTTAVLAALFIGTSLLLAIMSGTGQKPTSILDSGVPASAPVEPADPTQPIVPLAR